MPLDLMIMTSLKYCGVCGSNEDRPDNHLIICISCGIACHYYCHCQTELDEKGQWQCKHCELSDEHSCTDCCYCYNTNPLIYKTIAIKNTLSWAHITCVFSRLYFNVNNNINPCEICGSYDLYICKSLQSKYYHMSCALTAGYKLQWSECIDKRYYNNDSIRLLNNKEVSISNNMFLVIVNDDVDVNQANYFSSPHNSYLLFDTDKIQIVMRPLSSTSSSSSSSSSSSGYQLNYISNKQNLSTIAYDIHVPYLKSALKTTSSSSSSSSSAALNNALSSASSPHTDMAIADKVNAASDNITTSESIGTIFTIESSHSVSSSSSIKMNQASSSSSHPSIFDTNNTVASTVAPNHATTDSVASTASSDRVVLEQQQQQSEQLAVPPSAPDFVPPPPAALTHPTVTAPDMTQREVVELRRTVTLLASSYEWLEREMKAMGQNYDQLKRDVKKLQPVAKVYIFVHCIYVYTYRMILYGMVW